MRIYSIAILIAAYLSSTIVFSTALPTPFPTSRGLSPCNALGTDSIQDSTLNNVCNEADKVTRLPPGQFGDERDLQPRGNPKKGPFSVNIPPDLRNRVSGLPEMIYEPADPSNITPEERSRVHEILKKLHTLVADLGGNDVLRKQFIAFKSRVKLHLRYDVNYETERKTSITIPYGFRDHVSDLPFAISEPRDRSNITLEEQSRVDEIMQKLEAYLAHLDPADKLHRDFTNFKSRVRVDLGYVVKKEAEKPRPIKIPKALRDHQPGLPETINPPADPLKITREEQQHVSEILQKLATSVAGLGFKDPRSWKFRSLKSRVKLQLGYDVKYEIQNEPHYLNIPSPLRDKLSDDLPGRIFAPDDPSNITPEEQQHVFAILRKLKASIADVENKSRDERCQQFYQLKSNLHRNLGYEVNENSAPNVALSTESVGETSGTSFKP
ncbi:hypothetical protein H0H93_011968, partial [Arthromyces matolae]